MTSPDESGHGHPEGQASARPGVVEVGEDRLAQWVAVHNVVRPHDALSVSNMLDWRRQAGGMTWLLATVGDAVVGCGVGVTGWHMAPGVGRVEVDVLPTHRGLGVGRLLLAALSDWAAERGVVEVDTTVEQDDRTSLEWAAAQGFREVGRAGRLALDLTAVAEPSPAPPPGVEIVTWAERPDLAAGMYEVYREAAPDVPGEEDTTIAPYEQWLDMDMRGSSDSPDATFVAVAGAQVVGYAKLSLPDASPDVVWHDLTAVLRSWRGRGVAASLKRAEIAWAKRHGYRRLETSNELRNEPIRRLNARHGYLPSGGSVTLRARVPG